MHNNDLDCQKLIEWSQNQTIYLIHLIIDNEQLSIELEDKHTGDLWNSIFLRDGIEDLTTKAKNPKRYPVFVKMLLEALEKTNEELNVQIISYRQLSNRFSKGGTQNKSITPEQASKRFLILSYTNRFEKMQFPLSIAYQSDASADRLKLTVKRLALENNHLREGQDQQGISRQIALLRYQNQSLKNKIKMQKSQNSSFFQPKSEELERELREKNQVIEGFQKKCSELEDMLFEKDKKIKEDEQKINELEKRLRQSQAIALIKDKNNEYEQEYEEKLEGLIEKMGQLGKQLQYAKEKEKKSQLKITTLQKQLQKLIAIKHSKSKLSDKYKVSSPESKKSEKSLSMRSGRSNKSLKSDKKESQIISRKTYGMSNLNNARNKSNRKSSLYDSDTESSRMRRLNNMRSSPYRQGISNISANTKRSTRPSAVTKERSRSKSKESRKEEKNKALSPRPIPSELQSQVFTQVDNSSSDDERYERIENYMHKLKEKKGVTKSNKKKIVSGSGAWNNRVQVLQDMIKRAAMSTKIKQ